MVLIILEFSFSLPPQRRNILKVQISLLNPRAPFSKEADARPNSIFHARISSRYIFANIVLVVSRENASRRKIFAFILHFFARTRLNALTEGNMKSILALCMYEYIVLIRVRFATRCYYCCILSRREYEYVWLV